MHLVDHHNHAVGALPQHRLGAPQTLGRLVGAPAQPLERAAGPVRRPVAAVGRVEALEALVLQAGHAGPRAAEREREVRRAGRAVHHEHRRHVARASARRHAVQQRAAGRLAGAERWRELGAQVPADHLGQRRAHPAPQLRAAKRDTAHRQRLHRRLRVARPV